MTRVHFGNVFIQGGLGLGVLVQHFFEAIEIVQQIRIGKMTAPKIAQKARKTCKDRCGKKRRLVLL